MHHWKQLLRKEPGKSQKLSQLRRVIPAVLNYHSVPWFVYYVKYGNREFIKLVISHAEENMPLRKASMGLEKSTCGNSSGQCYIIISHGYHRSRTHMARWCTSPPLCSFPCLFRVLGGRRYRGQQEMTTGSLDSSQVLEKCRE